VRTPPPEPSQPAPRPWFGNRRLLWVIAVAIVANLVVAGILGRSEATPEVPYSVFAAQARTDNIAAVTSTGDSIDGTFRIPIASSDGDSTITDFTTLRPSFADDGTFTTLLDNGVEVTAVSTSGGTNWFLALLLNFGPALLLIGGYLWLMRRAGSAMSGMGGIGGFGRSKPVRPDSLSTKVTFADVAGIEEAKEELVEIVDFLRSPDRYRVLGARPPHGVLLMGAPGTGKTLLAKAVAGEADVPFFSMSASEFIEMLVGVGASRVRDLFDQAKAVAPAIVFIDELDAIGRARGSVASFGGVDEREQTLNQILTEMDGFTGNEGIIVLAATNRPDVLDPALLRAGRFDRRVTLNPPDLGGRAAILAVHSRSVPLAPDVDLRAIAATTPGMVGADLANLVNEAALTAARANRTMVQAADFSAALERIVLGAERKIMLSDDDRRRTAVHEGGHALVSMLQEGADPVRKVSIIPRSRSLGVTFQSPVTDRYGMSETYLRGRITGALGGRAAEEMVFGDLTTGAEADIEIATGIARQMVGRWGMSAAVGPVTVLPGAGADIGLGTLDPRAPSEATRRAVDDETRAIIDACREQALTILRANRERLDTLVAALLEHETLDEADAYCAAGLPHR
jgi:cell division protease FtsH